MDSLERRIFLGALTVMAISGGLVITINSMGNVKDKMTNRALINALWKFDVLDEKALIEQKQWSWRKLVCAGVMGCSLIVSTFVRVLKPKKAIMVAVSVFLVWLTYLLYFWNSLNKKEPKEEKTAGKTDSAHHSDAGWAAKLRDKETKEDKRLPVTIITGYLGSGKTTLVKNILKNTIGLKVLVIENEIGEEGIDHQLLMPHTAKEEIILMSNGCVCCTVRQDLIKSFHKMFENDAFAKLDWIVIETTGLADPAPLIQSFYMDRECSSRIRLDSVLTVVDSKHIPLHITVAGKAAESDVSAHGNVSEALQQISFADRIILNKTDLVSPSYLESLVSSISRINSTATILACEYTRLPLEDILNIKAFNPDTNRALHAVESVAMPTLVKVGEDGKVSRNAVRVSMKSSKLNSINKFNEASSNYISSISLTSTEHLDLNLFSSWISKLLQEQGENIFRLKGILSMAGYEEQFLAHGVHMIFDGERGLPWTSVEASKRTSKLVLIGKKLDEAKLKSEFLACISKKS